MSPPAQVDERHRPRHAGLAAGVAGVRSRLLRIDPGEAAFARRGFHAGNAGARRRLEAAGGAFLTGYNEALRAHSLVELAGILGSVDRELRGFAYEGAAMAATLIDRLSNGRQRRWRELLEGPGERYSYLLYVGAGWAWARVPVRLDAARRRLHPLYGWLGVDGLGFQHGYFRARRGDVPGNVPGRLRGYARRAFDQGLGRSLWFVHGADVPRISLAVRGVQPGRQSDLWSGVSLAATYAGPMDHRSATVLRAAGAEHAAALAQGAVFGTAARARSGSVTPETEIACGVLTDLDAWQAARLAEASLPCDEDAARDDAYERWRSAIRSAFSPGPGEAS